MMTTTDITAQLQAQGAILPDQIAFYTLPDPFTLESGDVLPELRLGYTTYGTLNAAADNVIWVCHALTANSDPISWWPGFVGDGEAINPDEHFIVCVNMIGSCYGSTGPMDTNPETGTPYLLDFPLVTVRDMVRSFQSLREHLGIKSVRLLMGGSMGGQQALEWAIQEPELFDKIIGLATNARHSAWGIAFNSAQRMAIESDQTFMQGELGGGRKGMEAARAVAMLSYRSYDIFNQTQTHPDDDAVNDYRADSYQRYQGGKLSTRFSAYSYYRLGQAMDSHHLGRNRGGIESALQTIQADALFISISSDVLFPPEEQKRLAAHVPNARHIEIDSDYGHDGFLVEAPKLSEIVTQFLND